VYDNSQRLSDPDDHLPGISKLPTLSMCDRIRPEADEQLFAELLIINQETQHRHHIYFG
jgi:hypothetical protein